MPQQTHTAPNTQVAVQIESRSESARIFVRAREVGGVNQKLTPAGVALVLAVLSTYYSGLSAANGAALAALAGDRWVDGSSYEVSASVLPADLATVAASLTTAVRTAGSVVRS